MDQSILGTSAVVVTTIPIAVGYALALQRDGNHRVAVAFFGDGRTDEGVFYERLNLAALHKLPVLKAGIDAEIERELATAIDFAETSSFSNPRNSIRMCPTSQAAAGRPRGAAVGSNALRL
jgi:hypothetical protein